jgi:dTDP-4-dehydrorhamnose reductase
MPTPYHPKPIYNYLQESFHVAKLLIFGAGGFIGGRLARAALAGGWLVSAAARSAEALFPGAEWARCDVTIPGEIERLVQAARPDAVANLAAVANIDRAEVERDAAYRVNTRAAADMASAAARAGCRFLHFSSDAVFDGTRDRYTEADPPNPLNYYGYTKAEAERLVLEAYPRAAILRISLALGFPLRQGNAFLPVIEARLSEGVEVFTPEEEIRTPVDTATLCAAALELAGGDFSGLLHVGALESIDRYRMTCRLAERMGFDTHLIRRAGPPLPGRAPRHKNGILSVEKVQSVLRTPMRSLDETLERALGKENP